MTMLDQKQRPCLTLHLFLLTNSKRSSLPKSWSTVHSITNAKPGISTNSWSSSFQKVGLCITAVALHYFLLVSLTWSVPGGSPHVFCLSQSLQHIHSLAIISLNFVWLVGVSISAIVLDVSVSSLCLSNSIIQVLGTTSAINIGKELSIASLVLGWAFFCPYCSVNQDSTPRDTGSHIFTEQLLLCCPKC